MRYRTFPGNKCSSCHMLRNSVVRTGGFCDACSKEVLSFTATDLENGIDKKSEKFGSNYGKAIARSLDEWIEIQKLESEFYY